MYPTLIIAGFAILAWGVLIILVGTGTVHFDDGALATAGGVLVALVGKAFTAIRTKRAPGPQLEPGEELPRAANERSPAQPDKAKPSKKDRGRRGFVRLWLLVALALLSAWLIGGCATVTRDNPEAVVFDLNRTTCALWVDVDGGRVLTINPGPGTKCAVKVAP